LCSERARTSIFDAGGEQPEPLDHLNAGDAREPDVREHDIGAQLEHELDRVLAAGGLRDELQSGASKRLAERGTDQRLVVNQRDRGRSVALRAMGLIICHLGCSLPREVPLPRSACFGDSTSRG